MPKILRSLMANKNLIVKLASAISDKPWFVQIDSEDMSVDRIVSEAIGTLRNSGRPLECNQLEQLYKTHQLFNNGQVVKKSDIFKNLTKTSQQVQNSEVEIMELSFVSAQSGGL